MTVGYAMCQSLCLPHRVIITLHLYLFSGEWHAVDLKLLTHTGHSWQTARLPSRHKRHIAEYRQYVIRNMASKVTLLVTSSRLCVADVRPDNVSHSSRKIAHEVNYIQCKTVIWCTDRNPPPPPPPPTHTHTHTHTHHPHPHRHPTHTHNTAF